MAWTTIPNSNLEPGAPIRSVDGQALRDNAIAIADGDSGAPRIQDAALSTTDTNTGRDWVMDRYLRASEGGVGTYAMLTEEGGGGRSFGETVSGSLLNNFSLNLVEGADSIEYGFSSSVSGTWRCMGTLRGNLAGQLSFTLFLRIS